MIKISIIIPTYNRIDDLKDCLSSILSQAINPYEVIVVDDSETDSIKEFLAKKRQKFFETSINILYIKNIGNKSLTSARNLGIQNANGNIILFLDDDVVLNNEYLLKMIHAFKENPQIYGLQGLVTNWPERSPFQKMFYHFTKKILHPNYDYFITPSWLTVYNPQPNHELSSCEWFSGCNQAYRCEVFEELKFDEQLKKYSSGEDIDFSYRVSRKYPNSLFLLSTARCVHNMSPVGRMPNEKKIVMQIVYATYFYFKNIPQTTENLIFMVLGRLGFLAIEGFNILKNHKQGRLLGLIAMIKGNVFSFKYRSALKNGDLSFLDTYI